MARTLTVKQEGKKLNTLLAKHILIKKLQVIVSLAIIVDPFTWCTQKIPSRLKWWPCNVKHYSGQSWVHPSWRESWRNSHLVK